MTAASRSPDHRHLDWPFFTAEHRAHAEAADAFARAQPPASHDALDASCRTLVREMGRAGLLHAAVPAPTDTAASLSSRSLCLIRETLAYHDPLADFCFAMQGLGTGAITLEGSAAQRALVLPRVARGEWIAAFALSEQRAGSDVAAMTCRATRTETHWVLEGQKYWISNGGIADVYVVVARTGTEGGTRGLSAFLVMPGDPGFRVGERIDVIAPHPLAELHFEQCQLPLDRLIGTEGDGFKLAMRTLDIFRPSVGAAALGMARRALDEAMAWATARPMAGATLADLQLTQAAIGQAATELDASALLVYRAAWTRDATTQPTTRDAAMAKSFATEAAQRIIDRAVQLFGGMGVQHGQVVEQLYREVRALRIYEGATEVQQLIIGRDLLRGAR